MRIAFFLSFLFCLLSLRAEPKAISLKQDGWLRNPLQWQRTETGWRGRGNGKSLNLCGAIPRAKSVSFEAVISVTAPVDNAGWAIAGIALVDDAENYWHFALVQAPADKGAKRYFELCEMREGKWLAQNNLTVEVSEDNKVWESGQKLRLRLRLDSKGIEGSAETLAGELCSRRRIVFSAPAVTQGRPALHIGSMGEVDYSGLRAEWSGEVEDEEVVTQWPAYTGKSFVPGLSGKATGFFRTEKRDGIWWTFDPLGRGFIPLGIDHVRYRGSYCSKLGYAPHGRWNDAHFANHEEWAVQTLQRLQDWGFNILTASHDQELRRRGISYTLGVNIGNRLAAMGDEFDITPNERRPCSSFPNMFHPEFASYCDHVMRERCKPLANDPWLFGYFLDNELAWWGRGKTDTGVFDATMKKNSEHTAKLALVSLMEAFFKKDLAAFNRAFGSKLESFSQILELEALPTATETARKAKHAFLTEAAERYFRILCESIRKYDPNHMILGSRFAGDHLDPVVWEKAATYCDILTFNFYGKVDLDENLAYSGGKTPLAEKFAELYGLGGKRRPLMITEWSFPALDSNLPCTHGAGQRFHTQRERSHASDVYARTMLSMPFVVGYDYFMWVDQPPLGISEAFPENTNYGITNGKGVPYPGLVRVLSKLNNGEAVEIHRSGNPNLPAPFVDDATRLPPVAPAGTRGTVWNPRNKDLAAGFAYRPGAAFPLCRIPAVKAKSTRFLKEGELEIPRGELREKSFDTPGQAWELRCGDWLFSGEIGRRRLVDSICYRGEMIGRYNAMLQIHAGRNLWLGSHSCRSVKISESSFGFVLDLVGEYRSEEPAGPAFRICHRLAIPREGNWFGAELPELRNIGESPLEVKAFFFRFFHPGEDGSEDWENGETVPRLWKGDCQTFWENLKTGAKFGACRVAAENYSARFWLNKQGGQHPDAKYVKEFTLAPAAIHVPESPVYFLGFATGKEQTPDTEGIMRRAIW